MGITDGVPLGSADGQRDGHALGKDVGWADGDVGTPEGWEDGVEVGSGTATWIVADRVAYENSLVEFITTM